MHSILLVEGNPDDELLALSAPPHVDVADRVDVARDGVEAHACFFGDDIQSPGRGLQ